MTVTSRDLRFARDVRPERRVVASYTRPDGWKLTISVERTRPDAQPFVVLRTFGPQERGSQVRVGLEELGDLEDAIAIARSWGAR